MTTASALDIDPTHLATEDVVATQALVDDVLPRLPQAWRDRVTPWPVRARFEDEAAFAAFLNPLLEFGGLGFDAVIRQRRKLRL